MADALHALEARGHALIAQLEEEGHVLAADLRDWFEKVFGEVKTNAQQVAHDAEAAPAPVVAEAEQDVQQVEEYATGGYIPGPRSPG